MHGFGVWSCLEELETELKLTTSKQTNTHDRVSHKSILMIQPIRSLRDPPSSSPDLFIFYTFTSARSLATPQHTKSPRRRGSLSQLGHELSTAACITLQNGLFACVPIYFYRAPLASGILTYTLTADHSPLFPSPNSPALRSLQLHTYPISNYHNSIPHNGERYNESSHLQRAA